MSKSVVKRRLTAILVADVAGYSRLMGEDEAGTLERLKSLHKELVQPTIRELNGRIVKIMGDGLLAEFSSVVEAVQCAINIQQTMHKRETDLSDVHRIWLRIGVNLGDIIVEGTDIYGDGVNVAARLEGLAEPGGICISGKVCDEVRNKPPATFDDLGRQKIKNIQEPVRVYRWAEAESIASIVGMDKVPSLPDKPSIAVLPFTNMSGDSEQEYFSDGISEDIITELSRLNSLFVVARNSSFTFRGRSGDILRVGRSLGVQFVLEGSVRKVGNRVRITAQLIDASTSDHIWADRYDGDLENIFELQDEISHSIVSTIAGRIKNFEIDRVSVKPTNSLSAYESVLRGQKVMHKYTPEDYDSARQFFEQAVLLDPKYARAHAWLAYIEIFRWFSDLAPKRLDLALRTGETALALDDHESKTHLALGTTHLFRFEHGKAKYHLNMASELNPNDDLIMIENARYLMYVGKPLVGADLVHKAMRRNPYHPNWYWNILGRCLHTAKLHDQAITALDRLTAPQFWNYAYLAACHAKLGQSREAAKFAKAVLSLKPGFTVSDFTTGLPYSDQQVLQDFIEGFRRAGLPS